MDMNTQAHPIETNRVPPSRLWFGVSAAAIAWAIQELLSIVIASLACDNGAYVWTRLSAGGVRALLAVITLGLLAVTVTAGFTSFRTWRSLSAQRQLIRAEGRSREEFMALIGVFVSAVFVAGILWAGIPLIMIALCRSAR
jgi:hypothetical protein